MGLGTPMRLILASSGSSGAGVPWVENAHHLHLFHLLDGWHVHTAAAGLGHAGLAASRPHHHSTFLRHTHRPLVRTAASASPGKEWETN